MHKNLGYKPFLVKPDSVLEGVFNTRLTDLWKEKVTEYIEKKWVDKTLILDLLEQARLAGPPGWHETRYPEITDVYHELLYPLVWESDIPPSLEPPEYAENHVIGNIKLTRLGAIICDIGTTIMEEQPDGTFVYDLAKYPINILIHSLRLVNFQDLVNFTKTIPPYKKHGSDHGQANPNCGQN